MSLPSMLDRKEEAISTFKMLYVTDCCRVVHFECYDRFLLGRHQLENPFPDIPNAVFCNKKHLEKGKKVQKAVNDANNTTPNIPWDRDGKNGPDDPCNSMSILLEWITKYGNYKRYKGDTQNGLTKIRIAGEIADLINAAGVRKERNAKSVVSKVDNMTSQYKKASDWANATGVGVLATEGKEKFDDAVSRFGMLFCFFLCSLTILFQLCRYCRYYFELDPILKDRVSTRPDFTSDDLRNRNSETFSDSDIDSKIDSQQQEEQAEEPTEEQEIFDDDSLNPSSNSSCSKERTTTETTRTTERPTKRPKSISVSWSTGTSTRSATRSTRSIRSVKSPSELGSDNGLQQYMDAMRTSKEDEREAKKEEHNLAREQWEFEKGERMKNMELESLKKKQMKLEYTKELMTKYKEMKSLGFEDDVIAEMVDDMRPLIRSINKHKEQED